MSYHWPDFEIRPSVVSQGVLSSSQFHIFGKHLFLFSLVVPPPSLVVKKRLLDQPGPTITLFIDASYWMWNFIEENGWSKPQQIMFGRRGQCVWLRSTSRK